jgi:hypothetical protein
MRVSQHLTARPTGQDEIREVDRALFSIGARSFSYRSQGQVRRLATSSAKPRPDDCPLSRVTPSPERDKQPADTEDAG